MSDIAYYELQYAFEQKYGEDWQRSECLIEEEEIEWVNACYEYFETERSPRETYEPTYPDKAWFAGREFEIVERIPVDDPGYDISVLPMWRIKIGSEILPAYPEEIFYIE